VRVGESPVRTFKVYPQQKVTRLAFTADGAGLLTAQPGVGVILRDPSDGRPMREFSGTGAGQPYRLIPSPCGRWLAFFQTGQVAVFDLGGRRRWALDTRYAYCLTGAWDGEDLLVGGGKPGLLRVRVGGAGGVERQERVAGPDRAVVKGLSPCGRWAIGCRRQKPPVLIDVPVGAIRAEFRQLQVTGLAPWRGWANFGPWPRFCGERPPAFADLEVGLVQYGYPLGEAIAAPQSEAVAVWDCESVKIFDCRIAVDSPPGSPPAALRPLRRLEVLASGTTYQLPAGISGMVRCHGPSARLPRLAFVPDRRTVLTYSRTQRVQRWDWTRGSLVGEWGAPGGSPHCLAVDPGGFRAAAGGGNGRVVVWDLD
jgi:hypothetical protein